MRKISLCLLAFLISTNLVMAKSRNAGFKYKCQVGNPEVFQLIGKRSQANEVPQIGESGKIEFNLTRKEPVANLDGQINRSGELVDVNLELRGISLASNKPSRPQVSVRLKDKSNDEDIFSARSVDADYQVLEDISVKCELITTNIKESDKSELAALFAVLFLSAGQ